MTTTTTTTTTIFFYFLAFLKFVAFAVGFVFGGVLAGSLLYGPTMMDHRCRKKAAVGGLGRDDQQTLLLSQEGA